MGGMVLETNMSEILTHIEAQNKLEKSEVSEFVVLSIVLFLIHPLHYPLILALSL